MPRQKQRETIILAAIEGFKSQKSRINQQIAELKSMLHGGNTNAATPSQGPGGRRQLSAAARRRIAQAQRERWRRVSGEAGASTPATPEAQKPKRRISKAGLRRIIAATKRRWALKRAEAARAQVTAKRSTPVAKKGGARKAGSRGPSPMAKTVKRAPVKRATKTAPAPAPTPAQAAG